jgi:beta-galactosidase
MKFVLPFALALVLSTISIAQPPSARPAGQTAFVPMAVSYDAVLLANRDRAAADLGAVRALGFNAIRLVVSWAEAEPVRGQYRLDTIDAALELASRSDLKVILRLEAASPPAWVFDRYTDGRYVPADGAPRFANPRACLDHPGIRADVEAFVAAATTRAAAHEALYAVDVGSDLETGFCLCPHTARRYTDWVRASFGDAPRSAVQRRADQAAFVLVTSRDHLAVLGAATSARGYRLLTSTARVPSLLHAPERPSVQDDWAMAAVVDRYGVAMPPPSARGNALTPAQLALAFDDIRGAAASNGWFASLNGDTTAADLRLWTWTAIARGARGVVFGDWRTVGAKRMAGLGEPDVRAAERAQTAAGVGRVIGRNPALFAPLRPAKAEVAIVFDPRGTQQEWTRVYQAFFERNIQVDVVHVDQLTSGATAGYAVTMSTPGVIPQPDDAAARVTPSVKISGASAGVETRFLESSDVLMLIGLNYNDTRQRVTMTFSPDTQEAIWQNMETGAAVNFIAGRDGPTYTYTFGAKDALVLMIRKNIR